MSEKSLHAALKAWYARPDDRLEVPIDGYIVDIVQDDLLIEVQTRNFSAIKDKLHDLTAEHAVRLVYPIAQEKWIVKLDRDLQHRTSRRKSPKRGRVEHLFQELVSIPRLLCNPNFALDVLLIQEEETRRHDGRRGWRRRGWVTHERHLLRVVERRLFETPSDMRALLPATLAEPFTTADLAFTLSQPVRLARRMAYCLRKMGVIHKIGKRGNAYLYTIAETQHPPQRAPALP
jgi:hypothetical protein